MKASSLALSRVPPGLGAAAGLGPGAHSHRHRGCRDTDRREKKEREREEGAHLLGAREGMIEAGDIGHDGLLVGPQRAHDVYSTAGR